MILLLWCLLHGNQGIDCAQLIYSTQVVETLNMKAIGYQNCLPIDNLDSLVDIDIDQPIATGHDLLVKIQAVAVNPVDYKIRQNAAPEGDSHKVIGWDAAGEVVAVGSEVSLFQPGDRVYYAGDLTRTGCNAEFQLVDERIVGHQPKSLSSTEAAALPLTTITAWELLFDHLKISQQSTPSDEVILVTGAAGGVGSIFIQLAKALTGATVIATASRPESEQWVNALGADYVINHTQPMQPQIDQLRAEHSLNMVSHVASLHSTEVYFDDFIGMLKPFGKIAMIDDPAVSLPIMKMKTKSLSFHTEFMFARSMYQADDMAVQGELLNKVAALLDEGVIRTTVGTELGEINAANLRSAHKLLESGSAIGKIVLAGF